MSLNECAASEINAGECAAMPTTALLVARAPLSMAPLTVTSSPSCAVGGGWGLWFISREEKERLEARCRVLRARRGEGEVINRLRNNILT